MPETLTAYIPGLPAPAESLLARMLAHDPLNRPTTEEILGSEYFAGMAGASEKLYGYQKYLQKEFNRTLGGMISKEKGEDE